MMKRKVSMLLLALAIALSFSFAGAESLFAASADSFGAGVTKAAPSDITKAGTPVAGALGQSSPGRLRENRRCHKKCRRRIHLIPSGKHCGRH